MFPEAENAPAEATQFPNHPAVAHPVAGDLFDPEGAVGCLHAAVRWTIVPGATVHENDNACLAEQEVRLSEHGLIAPPAGDARRAQQFAKASSVSLLPRPRMRVITSDRLAVVKTSGTPKQEWES